MAKANTYILATVLAMVASTLSVFVERTGPELAPYGNLCGPKTSDPCMEPLPKGGFPIAFLFDQPGVSVEHRLFLGEDRFSVGAFSLNTLLIHAASLVGNRSPQLLRPRLHCNGGLIFVQIPRDAIRHGPNCIVET